MTGERPNLRPHDVDRRAWCSLVGPCRSPRKIVDPTKPSRVGLIVEVPDMDTFQRMLESEAAADLTAAPGASEVGRQAWIFFRSPVLPRCSLLRTPRPWGNHGFGQRKTARTGLLPFVLAVFLVELRGLEPLTPCMPCRCATSCATAPSFFRRILHFREQPVYLKPEFRSMRIGRTSGDRTANYRTANFLPDQHLQRRTPGNKKSAGIFRFRRTIRWS
jgi:hypothetical protein